MRGFDPSNAYCSDSRRKVYILIKLKNILYETIKIIVRHVSISAMYGCPVTSPTASERLTDRSSYAQSVCRRASTGCVATAGVLSTVQKPVDVPVAEESTSILVPTTFPVVSVARSKLRLMSSGRSIDFRGGMIGDCAFKADWATRTGVRQEAPRCERSADRGDTGSGAVRCQ